MLIGLVDGKEKEATAKLIISNLSLATQDKTLELAIFQSGEIRGARIITSAHKGRKSTHGYVEFTSVESAAKPIKTRTSFVLDGRDIHLDFDFSRPTKALQTRLTKIRKMVWLSTRKSRQAMSLMERLVV
jgi:RNA recognition motif-containing protein